MPKPHRVLLDRVSGYADEAGAFMRRRRLTRRPFARVYYAGGGSGGEGAGPPAGGRLLSPAGPLIENAPGRGGRGARSGRAEAGRVSPPARATAGGGAGG